MSKKNLSLLLHRRTKKRQRHTKSKQTSSKKRNFRGLWIQRINAGVREYGMSYSQFINGIKKAEIDIDRKILADIAKNNPTTFKFIVDKIRQTK